MSDENYLIRGRALVGAGESYILSHVVSYYVNHPESQPGKSWLVLRMVDRTEFHLAVSTGQKAKQLLVTLNAYFSDEKPN